MKYIAFVAVILVSACGMSPDQELAAHLEAERDFHAHQQYLESIYNLDNYDPEYVNDCLFYEELLCEFE